MYLIYNELMILCPFQITQMYTIHLFCPYVIPGRVHRGHEEGGVCLDRR